LKTQTCCSDKEEGYSGNFAPEPIADFLQGLGQVILLIYLSKIVKVVVLDFLV